MNVITGGMLAFDVVSGQRSFGHTMKELYVRMSRLHLTRLYGLRRPARRGSSEAMQENEFVILLMFTISFDYGNIKKPTSAKRLVKLSSNYSKFPLNETSTYALNRGK